MISYFHILKNKRAVLSGWTPLCPYLFHCLGLGRPLKMRVRQVMEVYFIRGDNYGIALPRNLSGPFTF